MSTRAEPIAPPRRAANARTLAWVAAALALIYAVYGACWIVIHAAPLDSLALKLAGVTDQSDATLEKWFDLAVFGPILLLGLLGLLLFRQRPALGRVNWEAPAALVAGAAAVAVLVGTAFVLRVAGFAPAAARLSPALFVTGTVLMLLQVLSEEVLFRGLALPVLARAGGWWFAVVASALGFTIVHVFGDWTSPVSLLNIFLAGIWFALLAWRTGGLLAPVLAHFAYNWTEAMLFGATPNPGVGAFGSVVDIELSGKAIWGGSVEGFNASIVLTLILALLAVVSAWRIPATADSAKREGGFAT